MSQKTIRKGDICRIRHNTSLHGFPENTLVIIKECRPRRAEFPHLFKAATAKEWWWVLLILPCLNEAIMMKTIGKLKPVQCARAQY